LAQLPDPCLVYRVMVGGSRFPTMLILPRNLMLNIVGAMLGDDTAATDRELTLVEENLADFFLVEYWLAAFREVWPAQAATWVLDGREANPASSRTFAANDMMLALQWTIRGPWGEAKGTWLFPRVPLLAAMGSAEKSDAPPQPTPPGLRESAVRSVPLVVQVVLGSTKLKLSELRHLQVGDVLMFDESREDQALAQVGGRSLYRGSIGRSGSKKAFQIKSLVEKKP
jgi:flagellar motor switch protein FliM